ncbi:uncharacterized protein A4U43_C07F34020 [Asparagus officinalis]|uniref:Uncharacterized protein n=1 Tax=Asparagus officinalis TaxID=4686 RepID=A0A5P1EHC8_ASPOF|nr:uncharacterized protein A4U43_C07F34020 [Asparagus officinalis]
MSAIGGIDCAMKHHILQLFSKEGFPSSSSKEPKQDPPRDPQPNLESIQRPVDKGKQPMAAAEGGHPRECLDDLPPAPVGSIIPDLMDVVFKGVQIKITKASWENLVSALPNQDAVTPASNSIPEEAAIPVSSSNSTEIASSSDPPPGFENVKRQAKKKSSRCMMTHMPHRRHLSLLKKGLLHCSSKGKLPLSLLPLRGPININGFR